MSKRLQQMLAKSQDVKGVNDIKPEDVKPVEGPKTGVGLMAQLASAKVRIQELELEAGKGAVSIVPVSSVQPNPWQPRRVFDEVELRKLAGSIAAVGLVQPIIVRRVANSDIYQLVAGERRLRAHKILEREDIKVIVGDFSDEQMVALALAENFDRTDLADYEIALAIKNTLGSSPETSRSALADALGISRGELYRYLDFFKLPAFVIADLEMSPGLLGANAAKSIAATLGNHGDPATKSLQHLWPRLKTGDLEQGKIAAMIEASIARGQHPPSDRDIKKLFVGKEQAGSITKDAKGLSIKLKAAALSPEKETRLREFVEGLLKP